MAETMQSARQAWERWLAADTVDADTRAKLQAMDEGLVISCHDCSDGGIAVAVAEMCISGHIGAEIDTSAMPGEDFRVNLYSESCSRWIV